MEESEKLMLSPFVVAFGLVVTRSRVLVHRALYRGARATARGDTRRSSQVIDCGAHADARGAAQVIGHGAQAVACGAARWASKVFSCGAQTDTRVAEQVLNRGAAGYLSAMPRL